MKNQPTQTQPQDNQQPTPKTSNKKANFLQVVKFTLFSISAGIIQLGLCELLILCGLKDKLYWIAYVISLAASVIWNFTFNRKFTFKSSNNIPVAMILAGLFYAPFAPLSTLWSNALVVQAGWPELLVTAFTMVINFVLEFLWQKFVVFNDKVIDFITRKNKNKPQQQDQPITKQNNNQTEVEKPNQTEKTSTKSSKKSTTK